MNLAMAVSRTSFKHVGTPHSVLVDHGECCELAKHWLLNMHRSLSFSKSEGQSLHAPNWLRAKYQWGPVQWPLSWCEAVQKKAIDCGVFAAFAREILVSQSLTVYPAQVLLAQPRTYIDQWNLKWSHIFQQVEWIGENSVYHEVCAVQKKGEASVRIYDPTEGVWIDSNMTKGINGVRGVAVISPMSLDWGCYQVGQGKWVLA